MNATHDDQTDERQEPEVAHNVDEETASPGLTRNKSEGQTPGEILREGRLAHDYSIDDLCAQTKLSPHTVEALEDNDFQSLSQPVFARGYYRQCAKVLDLDVERMMAAYTTIAGEAPKPKIDHGSVGVGIIPQDVTPGGGFRFRGLLILALLVVAVAAVVVFVLPSNGVPGAITGNTDSSNADQSSQNTTTFEFNSSSDDTSGGGDNNGNPSATATASSGSTTAASTTAPSTPDVVGDNGGQPRTGKQPGGRNVNQTLGINPPNGSGDPTHNNDNQSKPSQPSVPPNRLVLTFSKRSWVRVTDANGDRMASGIFKPGDTKEFNGKPPYKITLGYAPGVKVTIGGQPVDVAGQTSGGSIAHLTVDAPKSGGDNG